MKRYTRAGTLGRIFQMPSMNRKARKKLRLDYKGLNLGGWIGLDGFCETLRERGVSLRVLINYFKRIER
jgi:hypothetical protein